MRRGSVSSWEPWARRNSANMAQIAGNRSEFMTSDLGLSDIEYKRKGGWFLSYKKIAAIIVVFIIGVIAAGIIGAYVSPWNKNRTITALALAEEDEIDGLGTPAKFSSSPSILPTLYTIELTPVLEESTVKKIEGHLIVRFTYNSTQPLSQIVLNAKGITVSKAKLFSLDDNVPRNVHARKKRDDTNEENLGSSDGNNNSSDTTINDNSVTNLPEITTNGDVSNVTSMDVGNETVFDSSNDNITTDDVLSLTSTPADVITFDNETSPEKIGNVLTGTSDESVVQNILPTVTTNRSISSEIPIPRTEIHIDKNETDMVDGFYVIYPESSIRRGDYLVEITYEAKIDGQSTFANVYEVEGQKKWLLATKLKPLGTRTLFPSFDDPKDKARFSLSVARPKTLITLANMPLRSSNSVSEDWVMDHFEKSPPLSSSNLAFLVGDLQPIREANTGDNKIPLTLWGRSSKMNETHFIANKIEIVTRTLNQFFSTTSAMGKLDVVALPGLFVNGIGSTGLISIKESLFYMSEESSAMTKEIAIKNLLKLIGEQWLGGLVSSQTSSDSWILEGSLIYLEHLLTEKIDNTIDSSASFGILQHDALEIDAYEVSKTLDSKSNSASLGTTNLQNTYKKGACLIRMLHNVISDSGFRNGYKKFLSRWTNSSASVPDFWNAMSDEARWLPDGVSLEAVMTSWVTQGGFPVVTVVRNYESGSAVIRQEQFAHDNSTISSKNQYWYIPLTRISEGDDWSSPRKSWLKQEEEVTIEDVGKKNEKKWVVFNVNQTGYYRVNYDMDNWNLLSLALNSTFEKFTVTTRTSLVDDALSLAWGGRLGYSTALNLIRYLKEKETHHSPWTVALQNMIKLNNLLQNTAVYSSFQEFMIKFISPILKKVTTRSGEDTQLKLMAIKWACLVDNPECQNYVKSLENVPEYLAETFECTIAKFGGKSERDSLISKTLNPGDRETKLRLLAALGCFQVQWILQSTLNDVLDGEKFDESETLVILKSFSQNPLASRTAFEFSRRHWNEIFQRYSKSYKISKGFLIASINGITDDQDLKDIFKEEYYEKLKFMGHTIAIAEAEARSRASWLKKNLLPVKSWLENYNGPRS